MQDESLITSPHSTTLPGGSSSENEVEQSLQAIITSPQYVVYEPKPNWRCAAWRRLQVKQLESSSDEDEGDSVEEPSRHHGGGGARHPTGVCTGWAPLYS